jgi:hypothetical protein
MVSGNLMVTMYKLKCFSLLTQPVIPQMDQAPSSAVQT